MITATFRRCFDSLEDLDLYCASTTQKPVSVSLKSPVTKGRELLEGGYTCEDDNANTENNRITTSK